MNKTNLILLIILIILVGILLYRFFGRTYTLPATSSTATEQTVTINGEEKVISLTDDLKHSIPLEEIKKGCLRKDCIPSIDEPAYVPVTDAPEWLVEDGDGIAFSLNGVDRFYPFQVLVTHEIVNDVIEDTPVLVTYCPLCLTGVVFDPVVNGERKEFGVSGKLWNSNLMMYNRTTGDDESLWSQITGEAVVGELTGAQLAVLPSDLVTFASWKAAHPDGEVLVGEQGGRRQYSAESPYGDLRAIEPFFPVNNVDTRLDENAFVMGLEIDGQFKAYDVDAVRAQGEVVEEFAGKTIVARHDQTEDAVRLFERLPDGTEERLIAIPSFWFSWVAVHPETELYSGE